MMTDACTLTAQHTVLATPIGDLTVVREGDLLTGLYFPHHWYKPDPVAFGPRNDRDSRASRASWRNTWRAAGPCSTCRLSPVARSSSSVSGS